MIEAVFCDIGGPIYSDENYFNAVVTALNYLRAERAWPPVPVADIRAAYDVARERQGGSFRKELASRFLGGPLDRDALSERTRAYWTHPPGTLAPDVIPFLRELARRRPKVIIGVLANQEQGVVEALERDGVSDYLDIWGVSALVGYEKPSVELFSWCLDQAGVAPAAAVHIGNRLDMDVRPAKSVGMKTVWLLRGEAPNYPTGAQLAEADFVARSLEGLVGRLFDGAE